MPVWGCVRCGTQWGADVHPAICPLDRGGCGKPDHAVDGGDEEDEENWTRIYAVPSVEWTLSGDSVSTGNELFAQVVAELERLMEFQHPWHSRVTALYILQTYLYQHLPAVFYLAFVGPPGTGKTTAVELATEMGFHGIVVGNQSPAYYARKRAKLMGCVGVDEIDTLEGERKAYIEELLRRGYKRSSVTVGYARWDYQAKKEEELDIYGPVCVSFRDPLEDALMTRMVTVGMAKVKDASMRKVLLNMIRNESALRARLEAFCAARMEDWPRGRVDTLIETDAFWGEVSAMVGRDATPRNLELETVMLIICKIIGIDLPQTIRDAFSAQTDFEESTESGIIREVVKVEWEGAGAPSRMYINELRESLNRRRLESKERPYSPKYFRRMLREIGLREGIEVKRVPGEGRHAIYFEGQNVQTREILVGSHTVPVPSPSTLLGFTGENGLLHEAGTGEVIQTGAVKSQDARVKLLIDIVGRSSLLVNDLPPGVPDRSFTVQDVTEMAEKEGLDVDMVDKQFQRWLASGYLYSPRAGFYRVA